VNLGKSEIDPDYLTKWALCPYNAHKMKKHSTNIHFDIPLWQWLKAEAERRHCSIGQVVRDLVVAEIERRK